MTRVYLRDPKDSLLEPVELTMDRAERIARERGAKKGWTEEQIQRRVWWRRAAREAGLLGLKALAGLGVSKAKAELEKRL